MGVGSFGPVSAVLFGVAMGFGPVLPSLFRRLPRVAGLVLAAHASVAITAFVLLLAWVSMG